MIKLLLNWISPGWVLLLNSFHAFQTEPYNYPKCLILLLLDVVSNIYKQHSYFPPNLLSSWCITTSPSTISELMFRSLPDPDKHLLKTAHCAMPLLEQVCMSGWNLSCVATVTSFEGPVTPALIMQPEVMRTLLVVIFPVGLIVITEQLNIVLFFFYMKWQFLQKLFFKFCKTSHFTLLISIISFLPFKIFYILGSVIWYINNIFQSWVIRDFPLYYTEINLDVHSTPI